jgi:hypothetical protein
MYMIFSKKYLNETGNWRDLEVNGLILNESQIKIEDVG